MRHETASGCKAVRLASELSLGDASDVTQVSGGASVFPPLFKTEDGPPVSACRHEIAIRYRIWKPSFDMLLGDNRHGASGT